MKTKLVDFDIEKAQTGAKVATRDGERARIVCYTRIDNTDVKHPIVALVMGKITKCECAQYYTIKGEWNGYKKSCNDLMIEESEFEDGDFINDDEGNIAIFKMNTITGRFFFYAQLGYSGTLFLNEDDEIGNLHLSTEKEKQRLLDALAKEGKRWNSEKKCIEELPRKTSVFKPFDKVLVRDGDIDTWGADIFLEYSNLEFQFRCFRCVWKQCIPYEGNERLLGTSNKPIIL